MQSINEIATHRKIAPQSARVALRRAAAKIGRELPRELTNDDPLPEWLAALIQGKAEKLNGHEVTPQTDVVPIQITAPEQVKLKREKTQPVKPIALEPVAKRTALDFVFGTQVNLLLALGILVAVDGISFAQLGQFAFGQSQAIKASFMVVGIIIGYTALQNTYTLSRKERGKYEQNPVGIWITCFAIAEVLIHSVAVRLFDDWSTLKQNEIMGRVLICVVVPVAKAGLSVLLFQHKKTEA